MTNIYLHVWKFQNLVTNSFWVQVSQTERIHVYVVYMEQITWSGQPDGKTKIGNIEGQHG